MFLACIQLLQSNYFLFFLFSTRPFVINQTDGIINILPHRVVDWARPPRPDTIWFVLSLSWSQSGQCYSSPGHVCMSMPATGGSAQGPKLTWLWDQVGPRIMSWWAMPSIATETGPPMPRHSPLTSISSNQYFHKNDNKDHSISMFSSIDWNVPL